LQESPVASPKANTTKPKKVAAPIKKAAVKKFAAKKATAQEIQAGEATAVESSAVEASAVESSAVEASAVESSAVEASAEEPAAEEAKLADEAARPASFAAVKVKVNKSGKSKKSHAAASVAKVKNTKAKFFYNASYCSAESTSQDKGLVLEVRAYRNIFFLKLSLPKTCRPLLFGVANSAVASLLSESLLMYRMYTFRLLVRNGILQFCIRYRAASIPIP
jgi:hypothetical protein